MFSNFSTVPVHDCNELVVFGSHLAGLHLKTGPAEDVESCLLKWAVPNNTVG